MFCLLWRLVFCVLGSSAVSSTDCYGVDSPFHFVSRLPLVAAPAAAPLVVMLGSSDNSNGGETCTAARSSLEKARSVSSCGSMSAGYERPCPLVIPEEIRSDEWDLTFSFSCGGWFQMYFFGAAHAIVDTGLLRQWELEGRRIRFAGASAGSLAAACLASGQHDFETIRDFCAQCAQHFRSSWRHLGCMREYLLESMNRFGGGLKAIDTDPGARSRLSSGCLEVSVTVLPRLVSRVINEFTSYEEAHEAIVASCCMVPLVGAPFKLKATGEWVTDGGITNFTPRMNDENVISVSAMYFQDASVRPRTFVPSWWSVFPPDDKKYRNLFTMGYNDMIDTLVSYELLDRELGEYMLKPETDFTVHDSYRGVFFTFVTEILMLIVLRPFIIACVYVEFVVSILFYAAKAVLFFDGNSLRSLWSTIRSTTSLRTFLHLLIGKVVPANNAHLSHSWLFRMFEPLTFGGRKKTGRECWSPSGSPVGRAKPRLSPEQQSPTQRRLSLSPSSKRFASPSPPPSSQ